jgi:uncharacterized hydrophobic protein (TIGR00271 family)
MMHLRITVPHDLVEPVVGSLQSHRCALNIAVGLITIDGLHQVSVDVPLEIATTVIDHLDALRVNEVGSIAGYRLDIVSGDAFVAAEAAAPGRPSEAIVWQQVIDQVSHDATASFSFIALLAVAVVIASIGILTESAILIVGAMVVGPDYGPVGAITVGLARRRRDLVELGTKALAVGIPIAIVVTTLVVVALRVFGGIPDAFDIGGRPVTGFISRPDRFTIIVAIAAGIAGTLSLTEAKAGVLVGVLISVTTVPAIANIAVGIALWSRDEIVGSSGQLLANVVCLVAAGWATLSAQRWWAGSRWGRQPAGP